MSTPTTLPPARHESTDGLPRVVAWTGGGLAVGVGLVLLAAAWVTQRVTPEKETSRMMAGEFLFEHGPQATTGVAQDWIAQERAVREHLQTYGWVDREAGVVRVPIERAMELLAKEAGTGTSSPHQKDTP